MKEVKIIWKDAKSYANEWVSIEEAERLKLAEVETKGYLINDTGESVIIAQSFNGNEGHNFIVIPKGAVISVIIEEENKA